MNFLLYHNGRPIISAQVNPSERTVRSHERIVPDNTFTSNDWSHIVAPTIEGFKRTVRESIHKIDENFVYVGSCGTWVGRHGNPPPKKDPRSRVC